MSAKLDETAHLGEPPSHTPEDKVASLFQPDMLLSAQYFDNLRRKTPIEPEKRLMLALLRDAVNSYRDNWSARSPKKKRLFDETEEWILEAGRDWIFSFDSVCESLGLNPAYVRRGLVRWKDRSQSERHRIEILAKTPAVSVERQRRVG